MNISDKIKYIGVDDTTLDLFESQYAVPDGVSYNSYVILDDKTAIMDTVDKRGMKDWENNLLNALDGRNADYVIIQHMEPDHAGSLARLIELFPEITVVGNAKTFVMINQFFENINIKNSLTVKEGDTLNLGSHTLTFVMAPMVHWPEVMVTYESSEKLRHLILRLYVHYMVLYYQITSDITLTYITHGAVISQKVKVYL